MVGRWASSLALTLACQTLDRLALLANDQRCMAITVAANIEMIAPIGMAWFGHNPALCPPLVSMKVKSLSVNQRPVD
jgi:hypothetical protein